MQSLTTFFEDNKPLAYAAVVAAVIVLIFVILVLYRLLFGRRLRAAANGRTRQPRLGIVDAYDLDRQRQLVLVRRDNVEHLIMIGGPTDVVLESTIVRSQPAAGTRDKDVGGPLVGALSAPPAQSGSAGAPALAPAASPAALPPSQIAAATAVRTEPAIATRGELGPQRSESSAPRTEPSLGTTIPGAGIDRPAPERAPPRPIAIPDPAAPPAAASQGDSGSQAPIRTGPQRPVGPPLRSTAPATTAAPEQDRPAPARTPLPPRPPTPRQPLPPRPSLASSLPPRPMRAPQPRPEPSRLEDEPSVRQVPPGASDVRTSADTEPRIPDGPEPTPRVVPPTGQPARNVGSLESLEEEMAKLLGRPAPRRDG